MLRRKSLAQLNDWSTLCPKCSGSYLEWYVALHQNLAYIVLLTVKKLSELSYSSFNSLPFFVLGNLR